MSKFEQLKIGLGIFFIMFFAQLTAVWLVVGEKNTISKFNLSKVRITKDLHGRAVGLMANQIWPFDSSQSIVVKVIGKRQVDEFVVVVLDVNVLAAVQKNQIKEQYSTSTTSKDVPKTEPKLPDTLRLTGKMKLTYELIEDEWYLLGIENLNLRASPVD